MLQMLAKLVLLRRARSIVDWVSSGFVLFCLCFVFVLFCLCFVFVLFCRSLGLSLVSRYLRKGKQLLHAQQNASASQGRLCIDNFTCCHTGIEVANQTFYLAQSQYTDTGQTNPGADRMRAGYPLGTTRADQSQC